MEKTIQIQKKRYRNEKFSYNSELTNRTIEKYCSLGRKEKEYLESCFLNEEYSMRRISRIIKVARTIADMEECADIREEHITEAVRFRSIDKRYWGSMF